MPPVEKRAPPNLWWGERVPVKQGVEQQTQSTWLEQGTLSAHIMGATGSGWRHECGILEACDVKWKEHIKPPLV